MTMLVLVFYRLFFLFLVQQAVCQHQPFLTLLDVQDIIPCENWSTVVVLSCRSCQGHQAVHFSCNCNCPVQLGAVLTEALNQLSADTALQVAQTLCCLTVDPYLLLLTTTMTVSI